MKRLASCSISVSVSDFQIGDDLRPGTGATQRRNALLQRRFEHQREEAAEHVTADGLGHSCPNGRPAGFVADRYSRRRRRSFRPEPVLARLYLDGGRRP